MGLSEECLLSHKLFMPDSGYCVGWDLGNFRSSSQRDDTTRPTGDGSDSDELRRSTTVPDHGSGPTGVDEGRRVVRGPSPRDPRVTPSRGPRLGPPKAEAARLDQLLLQDLRGALLVLGLTLRPHPSRGTTSKTRGKTECRVGVWGLRGVEGGLRPEGVVIPPYRGRTSV